MVLEWAAARAELAQSGRTRLRLGYLRTLPSPAVAALFGDFAASHPAKVEYTPGNPSDMMQSLQLAFRSNQLPDVFNVPNGNVATVNSLQAAGWFQPLADSFTFDKPFQKEALAEGFTSFGGKPYTFPIFAIRQNSTSLWFFKAGLEAAGMDPEAGPATWDDARKAALAGTKDGKYSLILPLQFGDRIAGYANYGRNRARSLFYEGEVYELYLRPEFQGLGFGSRLFNAARKDLGQSGLKSLVAAMEPLGPERAFAGGGPLADVAVIQVESLGADVLGALVACILSHGKHGHHFSLLEKWQCVEHRSPCFAGVLPSYDDVAGKEFAGVLRDDEHGPAQLHDDIARVDPHRLARGLGRWSCDDQQIRGACLAGDEVRGGLDIRAPFDVPQVAGAALEVHFGPRHIFHGGIPRVLDEDGARDRQTVLEIGKRRRLSGYTDQATAEPGRERGGEDDAIFGAAS